MGSRNDTYNCDSFVHVKTLQISETVKVLKYFNVQGGNDTSLCLRCIVLNVYGF